MMDKKWVAVSGIALVTLIAAVSSIVFATQQSFEERRAGVIGEMNTLIAEQKTDGEYRCCIDPPCDMCFLGHWIWGDGKCRCDDMIAKGEFDKVCPQCKKKAEEGQCKSSEGAAICELPSNFNGTEVD
ncbi:MAG: hypothetical protein ABIH11_06815 [Candidatus Altiarchaeota archaeon]